jgi:hypothetical protein
MQDVERQTEFSPIIICTIAFHYCCREVVKFKFYSANYTHKKKQLPSVVFKNVGYQFKNKKLIAIAPHTTKTFFQAHTHTRYNLSNEPREGRFLQKLIFQRFFPTL